jgi:hypothetical protein
MMPNTGATVCFLSAYGPTVGCLRQIEHFLNFLLEPRFDLPSVPVG